MAKRIVGILAGTIFTAVLVIGAPNYINLQYAMSQVQKADSRNEGIQVFVHYEYFVNPNVLIYDLRDVSGTSSPMDVTRVLLQYAEQQKARSFKAVQLSHRGHEKFMLEGGYFQELGREYGKQNPAYTLRTLPENLYKSDGSRAFGSWTGGMLGVLGRQMEDFMTWHRSWYIDELNSENNDNTHHAS
ncbi:hypothetical protein [Massilia sp. SYSU DXS3249]